MISVTVGNKYIEANISDTSIEDVLKLLVANCKITSISMGERTSDVDSSHEAAPLSNTSNDSSTAHTFNLLMDERNVELALKHNGLSWDVAVFDYIVTHPDEEYTPSIHKDLKIVNSTTKTPDIITGAVLRRLADKGIINKIRRGAYRLTPELVSYI